MLCNRKFNQCPIFCQISYKLQSQSKTVSVVQLLINDESIIIDSKCCSTHHECTTLVFVVSSPWVKLHPVSSCLPLPSCWRVGLIAQARLASVNLPLSSARSQVDGLTTIMQSAETIEADYRLKGLSLLYNTAVQGESIERPCHTQNRLSFSLDAKQTPRLQNES